MIERYTDHSANERTFLAWVRTGIAVMAFGFLVEKFNLFLTYLAQAAGHPAVAPHGLVHAEVLGVLMLLAGVLVLVLATARFAVNRARIARRKDLLGRIGVAGDRAGAGPVRARRAAVRLPGEAGLGFSPTRLIHVDVRRSVQMSTVPGFVATTFQEGLRWTCA